jgi:hypothetical protein
MGSRLALATAAAAFTIILGGCSDEDRCDVEFTTVSVPSLGGNTVPALVPTPIVFNGTGFPVGGAAKIILTADNGAACFADGTANMIEIAGTVTSSTTIEAMSPRCTNPIVGTGPSAQSLDLQGAAVQIWTECGDSALSAPGAIVFDRPDGQIAITGTSGPQMALQTIPSAFTITTVAPLSNVYDPPGGGIVDVTFVATSGTPFEGGLSVTATVPGALTSSSTITGVTPLAMAAADFTATVNVVFEDGTVGDGTPLAVVTFVAPPLITAVVNTRPPFVQASPTTFNTDRCLACVSTLLEIDGSNFAAGATVEIFDTAVGDTDPIGSGGLSSIVIGATQISGGSPTDATLSGLTQATVRVTNPDGQFATFTPLFFSTLDVLANVNASAQNGNNAEMNVAVNPTNPRNAIVASHSGGGFQNFFTAFTMDGGATWTTVLVGSAQDGLDPGDPNASRVDPMCAADAFGNFYIGYLEFERDAFGIIPGSDSNVVILQSADGGATWINPRLIDSQIVPANGDFLDRCEMGTGPALGAGGGQAICVAFRDFIEANGQLRINGFRSTGLGNLSAGGFGLATVESAAPGGGNDYSHPSVAIAPNGQLYVSFIERNGNTGPANVWINTDPDGLGSGALLFGAQSLVTTTNAPSSRVAESANFVGDGWPIPQRNRGYACIPSVEVVQGGPFVGRVVVAYDDRVAFDGVPGNEVSFGLRIMTRFSDSGGATWSSASQAHVLDTRHQWQPWLASDPVSGNVYVTWYDSIGDVANNRAVRRFSAVSSDGGGWGNQLQLSQFASDVINDTFVNNYLEYEGVAVFGGCVYACWNDFSGLALPGSTSGEIYASIYQQDP